MERENQQTPDGLELADGLHNGPLVLATRAHAKRKEHPSLFICAHNRIFLARPALLRVDHRADPLHDRRHGRGLDRGGRVRRAWFLASGKDGRDEKEQNANRGKHLGTDENHFAGLAARADSAVTDFNWSSAASTLCQRAVFFSSRSEQRGGNEFPQASPSTAN